MNVNDTKFSWTQAGKLADKLTKGDTVFLPSIVASVSTDPCCHIAFTTMEGRKVYQGDSLVVASEETMADKLKVEYMPEPPPMVPLAFHRWVTQAREVLPDTWQDYCLTEIGNRKKQGGLTLAGTTTVGYAELVGEISDCLLDYVQALFTGYTIDCTMYKVPVPYMKDRYYGLNKAGELTILEHEYHLFSKSDITNYFDKRVETIGVGIPWVNFNSSC